MTPARTDELLRLADALDEALAEFLEAFGDVIPRAKAKQKFLQLCWDDKFTIIQGLRASAHRSGVGAPGASIDAFHAETRAAGYVKDNEVIDRFLAAYHARSETGHAPSEVQIRDAALEEAAKIAETGCLVPPDGGSPTEDEREMSEGIASAIRVRKLFPRAAQEAEHCGDDESRMEKISALIARLQSTLDQWGDTCVYIRRGGLSWGAVALNRQDDDRKHGVFDLQAQHDRDMEQRVGQVERLIADRNRWMERAMAAEALSVPSASRETLIGGTNFCGHGMMAVSCPTCSVPSTDAPGRDQ